MYEFRQLSAGDMGSVKELFRSVFTAEPWNDDWSDDERLSLYLADLSCQTNSLLFGLFEKNELIGISLGQILHWYAGTEYKIEELCIKTEQQGRGAGTFFVSAIENAVKARGISSIVLLTSRDVPAYGFYKKIGFRESESLVFFAKEI
ncbi:GNAT family N-acetyltransferase [Treponema saccharophilum]|uniref:GCN5-related N-acetyltransferase n=1 Tax=Treponema saccharophilum DSM 2985 TaxID=907348 RepID=H7EL01_9SPIR|nr:GNAT family N-acetyltransferase [Treponema saccharophilum]EIC01726.1 GCN5-related N-acetyltransferase [Treponema saccharophilum DSM 2985]BDC97106.1 N-acetyltransferase [Treponema saccharophilum]